METKYSNLKTGPFFSVIIPVYNKGPHIHHSISSVLNQTFQDFEIILIDDASTDNSLEEIRKFTDPRIRILNRSEPGPGGYAARNLGIKEANAEWVALLDADDIWYPEHLGTAKGLIDDYAPSIVVLSYEIDSRPGFVADFRGLLNSHDALILMTKKDFMQTNALVARGDTLEEAGLFPAGKCKRGGDSDLWLRLILTKHTIAITPAVTSLWMSQNSDVVSNKENLSSIHPATQTVRSIINSGDYVDNAELRVLAKISNRRSLAWFIERKSAGTFSFRDLRLLYFYYLDFKSVLKVFTLFFPLNLFNFTRMVNRYYLASMRNNTEIRNGKTFAK